MKYPSSQLMRFQHRNVVLRYRNWQVGIELLFLANRLEPLYQPKLNTRKVLVKNAYEKPPPPPLKGNFSGTHPPALCVFGFSCIIHFLKVCGLHLVTLALHKYGSVARSKSSRHFYDENPYTLGR